MKITLLSKSEIEKIINMKEVLEIVEKVFR